MNGFFSDIRSEVRKGNWASVLFLVLIVIILFAVPVLWFKMDSRTQEKDEVRVECAREMARRDAVWQRRIDSVASSKDAQFSVLLREFSDFKNDYIAKLENSHQESEKIVKDTKKIVKAIDSETKKTKQSTRELDSVSKSIRL